jgi:hypothetical protein
MISLGLNSSAIVATSSMPTRGLAVHPVGDDVVELAGDVQLHPLREVAALVQVHPEDRVAGLQEGVVDGGVGLRAGVRLDFRVLGAEQLLGAVERELFGDVDELAAAVVAAARVALGVPVREDRALAVEDRRGTKFSDAIISSVDPQSSTTRQRETFTLSLRLSPRELRKRVLRFAYVAWPNSRRRKQSTRIRLENWAVRHSKRARRRAPTRLTRRPYVASSD